VWVGYSDRHRGYRPQKDFSCCRCFANYNGSQWHRSARIGYMILLPSPSVAVPPPSPRARHRAWSPVL
jgi:hypothetical protein